MENPGRNDPCPCGSGLKYKKCCWGKPPKLKFSAKVIKSNPQAEEKLPSLMQRLQSEATEKQEFKMTDHDFRVSDDSTPMSKKSAAEPSPESAASEET